MEHLINYYDIKQEIDSVMMNASHSLNALIALYQDCDEQLQILLRERQEMTNNSELKISASMLNDAYELVEDAMNTMGMLIVHIGKDEHESSDEYVDIEGYIEEAKGIMPSIASIIHTTSSQMSDFIALHKSFEYNNIDTINPIRVNDYMSINKKVSRISTLVYHQIKQEYDIIMNDVNELISQVTYNNMVMEAADNVKGKYFVSIIGGMSIIEVGESETDVLRKTREYFDGELDDSITIRPCSEGVYNEVTNNNNIPDEWETVDGVVVLPEERTMNERTMNTNTFHTSTNMVKLATNHILEKIKERVNEEFENRVMKVDGSLDGMNYVVKIVPDTIVEKNRFSSKDKRVVLDIYRKLQKHEWFEKVTLGELDNGTITLSLDFNKVDAHDERPIIEQIDI